jgi:hypothetical protein
LTYGASARLRLLVSLPPKQAKENAPNETAKENPVMAGNDKDEHGCIGFPAGYVWSALNLQDCVRAFEVVYYVSAYGENHDSTYAAYATRRMDRKKAEVFLPGSKPGSANSCGDE